MRLAFSLAVLCAMAPLARAQSSWSLMDVNFRLEAVDFKGISPKGVLVATADGQKTVPFDDFLQVERAVPPQPSAEKYVLHLAGGDSLRGEPISLKDDQLTWKSGALGEVTVSIRTVRAIVTFGKNPDKLEEERRDDVIVLGNGDSVRGIVTGIEGGKVSLQTLTDGAAITPRPMESVVWILFASPAQGKQPTDRSFRVSLNDGSIFRAASLVSDGNEARLTLADGKVRLVPFDSLLGVEQINGPVSWLSSRIAQSIEQTPFFGDTPWPTKMDRNLDDKPIRFSRTVYRRGIAVHARSKLVYELDGTYKFFRTQYAIDLDRPAEKADVLVRVLLDDKIVHEQADFRAGRIAPVLQVELGSAKTLTLEVDYGRGTDTQDRLNWIEPALLKSTPKPPAALPAAASTPTTVPSPATAEAPPATQP